MLHVTVTDRHGRERQPEGVLTVVLDCDERVPADSMTVSCLYDAALRTDARRLNGYTGDRLVFTGALDNIVTEKTAAGMVMRLNARSLAAGLLDNEAEPVTYRAPGAALIERRHLQPFGIRSATADNTPYCGTLKIDKGMSHWQVLRRFCRSCYHCEPRVTGDGRAFLDGKRQEETVLFADTGEGVAYYALKESRQRHRLLSEIRLKFKQTNSYSSVLRNSDPEAADIRRVRFVNAAADHTTIDTAQTMLQNSSRDSYVLRLFCPGCQTETLGKRAAAEDSRLGRLDGLTVARVRYTADRRGEKSEVYLRRL